MPYFLWAIAAIASVTACASHAATDAPEPFSASIQDAGARALPQCSALGRAIPRDSLATYAGKTGSEDVMVRLSRTVPGGLTSIEGDANDPLVLQMADTSRANDVRGALVATFGTDQPSFVPRVRAATTKQVAFSAADLVDWMDYVSGRLFTEDARRAGITSAGIGVDFHRVRIDIYTPHESDRAWVESTLGAAQIPCGLVQTELRDQATMKRP
jgi:hypothetical protein